MAIESLDIKQMANMIGASGYFKTNEIFVNKKKNLLVSLNNFYSNSAIAKV